MSYREDKVEKTLVEVKALSARLSFLAPLFVLVRRPTVRASILVLVANSDCLYNEVQCTRVHRFLKLFDPLAVDSCLL